MECNSNQTLSGIIFYIDDIIAMNYVDWLMLGIGYRMGISMWLANTLPKQVAIFMLEPYRYYTNSFS